MARRPVLQVSCFPGRSVHAAATRAQGAMGQCVETLIDASLERAGFQGAEMMRVRVVPWSPLSCRFFYVRIIFSN